MKHLFKMMLLAIGLLYANSALAVYVEKMPVNKIQPNGDTVSFFVTGDEFYHRYHDADNYTIIQNTAGYWVYAMGDKAGNITPTQYLANTVNPAALGLTPGVCISTQEYQNRRKQWEIPEPYRATTPKTSGPNHGDFCNLVVFIRFADDTIYTRPLSSVDRMFTDSSSNSSVSVYNFFKKQSYNKIFIRTVYAPTPDSNHIISVQDEHPRAYYMPYNDNNPIGYTNYSERVEREFDLLENAVNWINQNSPVPSTYNLDNNNDGDIDNVNFVVKGSYTGWNDLLWPHKFNLYSRQVFINGKRVNTFNLALEGAGDDYFGTSTFCHEMFHSLGAPDLYHYNSATDISPVGSWDLMATNQKPPQHSTAWIKFRYGNWLDSIPLIKRPGTYTLTSVADSIPGTMALRFPSSHPNQFYVVEYRDNTELFETKLPGKGLIVYRVDASESGNSNYDGAGNNNEIWVFRPGSAGDEFPGNINDAFFNPRFNRTEFSPSSPDCFPYLCDGTRDYSFSISSVSSPGNTCSFYYTNLTAPAELKNQRITTTTATLTWQGLGDAYRVYYRTLGSEEDFTVLTAYSKCITLYNLESNAGYEWYVRSLYDTNNDHTYIDSSKTSQHLIFYTQPCNNSTIDTVGWYTDFERAGVPFVSNQKYNYTQILYNASELNGAKNISSISLHYAYTTNLVKTNCTIYMANTTLQEFDEHRTIVPFSEMTPVFAGDLTFTRGWNEIPLQNTFFYNGTDNLVIAIDDNSGTYSRNGDKFYMHNTPNYSACAYYGTDDNPDPEQDSIIGSFSRQSMRPNIKLTGCPVDETHIYACVISNNPQLGTVSGEGLYETNSTITVQAFPRYGIEFLGWQDGNTDNPRQVVLTQDTLFLAIFHSPVGIDQAEDPAGFVVLTQQLRITIQGADQQPIRIFDIMGRPVATADVRHPQSVTFQLPHRGVYIIKVGNQPPAKIFVN